MTEEKLRESARSYEEEIGSKSKPTQVAKLQQTLQIKGNSPLLHIDGFNPVDGRGLDAQHQLLGPVKESFKKSLTPAFRVKDPRYSMLHFFSPESFLLTSLPYFFFFVFSFFLSFFLFPT